MMRQQSAASLVVLTFCLLLNIASWLVTDVDASIPRSFSGSIITPSSYAQHPSRIDDGSLNNEKVLLNQPRSRPAWNASPKINSQGYLCDLFRRIPGEEEGSSSTNDNDSSSSSKNNNNNNSNNNNLNEPVIIRQVPGDGCCLFHAIAISLNVIQEKRHLRMDDVHSLYELKSMSRSLRHMAVRCLRSCTGLRNNNYDAAISSDDKNSVSIANTTKKRYRRLFIQGYETMATNQLLKDVSIQYGITPEEYCNLMEQDSYWGGGPEIVALCNVLERPIHVYELVPTTNKHHYHLQTNNNNIGGNDDNVSDGGGVVVVPDHRINTDFYLRRMATFGSPKYDSKIPLHILSADSRFPDISPNIIKSNGNHFMAIFPVSTMIQYVNMSQINNNDKKGSSSSSSSEQHKRRAVIRGGDASNANDGGCHHHNRAELDENNWLSHDEWFNCFIYNSAPTLDGGNSDWLSTSSASSRRRSRIHQARKVSTCWYRKMLFRRQSTNKECRLERKVK